MSEKLIITEEELNRTGSPVAGTPHYPWENTPSIMPGGYYKGEPWVITGDRVDFSVPDIPYVFQGIVETTDSTGKAVRTPANILSAHGFRARAGGWVFKDGRSVPDFIAKYNSENPTTPIGFAAVCNPSSEYDETTEHIVGSDLKFLSYFDQESQATVLSIKPDLGSGVMRSDIDPAEAIKVAGRSYSI